MSVSVFVSHSESVIRCFFGDLLLFTSLIFHLPLYACVNAGQSDREPTAVARLYVARWQPDGGLQRVICRGDSTVHSQQLQLHFPRRAGRHMAGTLAQLGSNVALTGGAPLTTHSWLQVSQQHSSLSGVQQQATMVQSVHVGSSGILQFAATTTGAFDTVSAVLQTAGHASH